jgi:hypothetical protein
MPTLLAPAAALVLAALAPVVKSPRVEAAIDAVDPTRLRATVGRLAAFGTRHTLSETASPTRGIGAARRWLAAEVTALAKLPGSRVQPFEDRFTAEPGPRVPRPVEVVNVGALLPGADPARAREAIVVAGHYDSRATDVLDATSDAPGAVDDASGVAIALELCRVLARERPAVAIYCVAVAGEEQGLLGSAHLAKRLAAEGIRVIAMAALDTVVNATGHDGVTDTASLRIFSEGVSARETEAERKLREALGAENDGPAREWARYLERVGERHVHDLNLRVLLRRDRINRGGDHTAFAAEGFPAIRLTEARENYDRQHQVPRTEDGRRFGDDPAFFDAGYAARVARALGAAVASLAFAPAPVRDVRLGGAVSPDTRLRFTLPADPRVAALVLYRRRAETVAWEQAIRFPRGEEIALRGVIPDDGVFAVATVDAEGHESLPVFPSKVGD